MKSDHTLNEHFSVRFFFFFAIYKVGYDLGLSLEVAFFSSLALLPLTGNQKGT